VAIDASARITIDEANRIAQETTGGEMSVVRESERIELCRKGHVIVKELHQVLDMTGAGIRRALIGWENWPPNRR
jgi:RNase P/RNase MRP subunit p29